MCVCVRACMRVSVSTMCSPVHRVRVLCDVCVGGFTVCVCCVLCVWGGGYKVWVGECECIYVCVRA